MPGRERLTIKIAVGRHVKTRQIHACADPLNLLCPCFDLIPEITDPGFQSSADSSSFRDSDLLRRELAQAEGRWCGASLRLTTAGLE